MKKSKNIIISSIFNMREPAETAAPAKPSPVLEALEKAGVTDLEQLGDDIINPEIFNDDWLQYTVFEGIEVASGSKYLLNGNEVSHDDFYAELYQAACNDAAEQLWPGNDHYFLDTANLGDPNTREFYAKADVIFEEYNEQLKAVSSISNSIGDFEIVKDAPVPATEAALPKVKKTTVQRKKGLEVRPKAPAKEKLVMTQEASDIPMADYVSPEGVTVTREDFAEYVRVQQSGVTNMLARKVVLDLTGLSNSVYMAIIQHYADIESFYQQ